MIRNLFYNICFNRRFDLNLFKKWNSIPILRNLHNNNRFICLRSFSTTNTSITNTDEPITISYGPKDTLLITGYNIKENELKDHIKMLEEALKLKLMTLDFYSPDIANSYSELGMVQHQSLEYINKAKENYIKSYEIWKKIKGHNSREVANILCLLGVVMRDLGEIEASKSTLLESLSIDRDLNTPESNLCSVYSLNNLANISHLQENYNEACEYYEDAIRILLTATSGDINHRLISLLYYNLGCSYYRVPDMYNAMISLNRASEIISRIGDPCNILHKISDLQEEINGIISNQ